MLHRIVVLFIGLLLALSLASAAAAQQAENPLVKLEGATQYEITNLQDEFIIRIPVTLQPGVKAVTPMVASVALGKRNDQALSQLFKPDMETGPSPVLIIKVQPRTLEQGTYAVLIDLRDPAKAAAAQPTKPAPKNAPPAEAPAAKHQFLKIEITLPEAKLSTFEPVVIEQVNYLFGWVRTPGPPKLSLTEISGHKTQLNDVRINQTEISNANEPTHQIVKFDSVGAIAPLDTGRSEMTLSGPFPLGTTKGKALISSGQLSAPVPVSFEVKAHRWEGFIVIIIILGLLLGFLARVWTKQRIELQQARLKAVDVLETLQQEDGRHPDADFHTEIEPSMTNLRTAINSAATADILSTAVTNAGAQLKAALQNLDGRRAAVQSMLETLKKVDHLRADLPENIAGAVQVDPVLIQQINNNIQADNISAAKTALDQTVTGMGNALTPIIQGWSNNVLTLLDQINLIQAFLPPNFSVSVTQETAKISEKLGELPAINEGSTAEALLAIVTSIRELNLRIKGLARRLGDLLTNASNTLKIEFGPNAPAIEELFVSLDQLNQKLPEWTAHLDTSMGALQNAISGAQIKWRQQLIGQLKGNEAAAVEKATDAVNAFLDQNQYWNAALAVAQFLRANPLEEVLGDEETGIQRNAPLFFVAESPDLAVPQAGQSFTIIREKTIPPTIESLRVSTLQDLIFAKAIRWIIASIGIVLIGYVLFADKFVGTLSDILAIFVWAFGVDISVDALLDAGKKIKQA